MTIDTDMVCLFNKVLPKRLHHKTVNNKNFICKQAAFAFRYRSDNYRQHVLVFVFCAGFNLFEEWSGCSKKLPFVATVDSCKGLDSGKLTVKSSVYYMMYSLLHSSSCCCCKLVVHPNRMLLGVTAPGCCYSVTHIQSNGPAWNASCVLPHYTCTTDSPLRQYADAQVGSQA